MAGMVDSLTTLSVLVAVSWAVKHPIRQIHSEMTYTLLYIVYIST